MGIGEQTQAFIKGALNGRRPGFSVCELGSQIWHTGRRAGISWRQGPAIEFWREIGAAAYDCIDANGKGTIKHDLNKPIPAGTVMPEGGYDVVTDFGTAEHIFDQAQVWRTLHYLCRPGGLILKANPYSTYRDHGFYCYHPTLIRDIAEANDYGIVYLELVTKPKGIDLLAALGMPKERGAFRVPVQGKYKGSVKL